jgi:hypothetical protein
MVLSSQIPRGMTGGRMFGNDALLQVMVDNSGPSIIQSSTLVINFPSRLQDVTETFFFLYPSTLTAIGVSYIQDS